MARNIRIYISAVFLLSSQIASFIGSNLIQTLYPNRPLVPDLLFNLVPQYLWLEYLSDPLISGSILILLFYIISSDRKNLSYYFLSIGSVYYLRAFLMILTPIGRPTGNTVPYGLFKFIGIMQHGMFPSGHVALSFIIYLMISGNLHRGLKIISGYLCILQIIVLILSRGHYSIDIAGGLLVSWAVWSFPGLKNSHRL